MVHGIVLGTSAPIASHRSPKVESPTTASALNALIMGGNLRARAEGAHACHSDQRVRRMSLPSDKNGLRCSRCQPAKPREWLVWAGPLFDGAAPQPPSDSSVGPFVIDAIERPGVEHSDYSRDLHMDWSTLCENVMDPAHLPYTHHKTISKRDKAQPIPFANLSPLEPEGFSADRPTEGWPGKVTFRAPHLVLAETHRATDGASGSVGAGSGQFSDWNVVYAVPTSPGKCRLLVRVCFEVAKMKPPLK